MGIWSRLGSVINSYMNDFERETSGRFRSSGDPDLDAAYEELDDYLNRKEARTGARKVSLPPEQLRADFEYLGVPFGADVEACKAAYKKLLKIHHPDRHSGHEGNYKKATEKSAKINAAWDRIEKWRANGSGA
jgi:DnaJ-domain-containing protein 1